MKISKKKINKQQNIILWLFGIFGCLILPVLLILFGLQGDIIEDSLSDVGGKYGHYSQLVYLSLGFCIYYAVGGWYVLKLCGYKDYIMPSIYVVGVLLYFITVVVPFLPAELPILAGIHNILARVSIAIMLPCVFWFTLCLFYVDKWIALGSIVIFMSIIGLVVWMIVKFGTCIIGEFVLQIYLCVHIFAELLIMTKKNVADHKRIFAEAYCLIKQLKSKLNGQL
jgi:hypothetical protein